MIFDRPKETPEARFHKESLGDFELTAISDGGINYPAGMIFGNVPPWEAKRLGIPDKQVFVPYTIQLVRTPDRFILIDVGAGAFGDTIDAFFPGLDHSTSRTNLVVPSLRAAGVARDQIDTVIVTHAHVDHVGGLLDTEGALVFPKAHYYVGRKEREYWESADPSKVEAEALREHLAKMIKLARNAFHAIGDNVTLVEEGKEVAPGVRIEATFGHTPGHAAVTVSSGGKTAYNISDLAVHPLFVEHPEWSPAIDMDWKQADETRRRYFAMLADEKALVFAHHLGPFPSFGRIGRKGETWQWEPLGPSR